MFDWVLNTHLLLKLLLPLTHLKILVSSNSLLQSAANENYFFAMFPAFALNAGNVAKNWFPLAAGCYMYKHLDSQCRKNQCLILC